MISQQLFQYRKLSLSAGGILSFVVEFTHKYCFLGQKSMVFRLHWFPSYLSKQPVLRWFDKYPDQMQTVLKCHCRLAPLLFKAYSECCIVNPKCCIVNPSKIYETMHWRIGFAINCMLAMKGSWLVCACKWYLKLAKVCVSSYSLAK